MSKVFIVEDDVPLQELYENILTSFGFNVIGVANNGEEAIIIYSRLSVKPDVVLMDYQMPLKNGIETTKEILKLDNNLRVIFISAYPHIKELALSTGASIFLEKPFEIKELISSINFVLEHLNIENKNF